MYEATWESVGTHPVPEWYDDAKLGVFIHWGLYSVPAWAPRVPDIQELLLKRGPKQMLRENPYAEWYLNTMQIRGSSTQRHHLDVYGDDYPYDNFAESFNDASSEAELDALAALCQYAGARYAVLTAKHSDGFALWPSAVPHPVKGAYHACRDLVGDLSDAVRARGLRMGLYYSGGYDWSYSRVVLENLATAVLSVPQDRRYLDYVTAHVRELIDRYHPSVLWNDISWPRGGNLADLFAYFYNRVDDGLVNDRWAVQGPRNNVTVALVRVVGGLVQRVWGLLPEKRRRLTFPSSKHCDFHTAEYAALPTTSKRKWELCRGVGHSFGANSHERPEDILSTDDLITMFCDIVSKNGNLLIGVGPAPTARFPSHSRHRFWGSVSGSGSMAQRCTGPVRGTLPSPPLLRGRPCASLGAAQKMTGLGRYTPWWSASRRRDGFPCPSSMPPACGACGSSASTSHWRSRPIRGP